MVRLVLAACCLVMAFSAHALPTDKQVVPAPGATWTRLAQPEGGQVKALVAGQGAVYAVGGPVHVSTNAGASWTQAVGLESTDVFHVATRGKTVYAGTQTVVYESQDRGQSWKALPWGIWKDNCGALVLAATSGSLYARGRCGVARWDGQVWKLFAMPNGAYASALAASGKRAFAVGAGRLYTALDSDAAWSDVGPAPGANIERMIAGPTAIVALAGHSDLHVSMDEGRTWTARKLPGKGPDAGMPLTLAGTTLGFVGSEGAFLSKDWGTTWQPLGVGLEPGSSYYASLVAVDKSFVAAVGKGVFVLDKRGKWVLSQKGLNCRFPLEIMATTGAAILRTADDNVFRCDVRSCTAVLDRSRSLWQGPDGGLWALIAAESGGETLMQSTDGGQHWLAAEPPLPKLANDRWSGLGGGHGQLLAYSTNHIYALVAGSSSWQSFAWPFPSLVTAPREAVTVAGQVIVGSYSKPGSGRGVLWRTSGGTDWRGIEGPNGPVHGIVTGMAANERQVFANLEGKIIRATLHGATFSNASVLPLAAANYSALAVRGNQVWVGNKDGVVQSDDSGTTWHATTPVFPAGQPTAFALGPDALLVSAGYRGVWQLRLAAGTTPTAVTQFDPPRVVVRDVTLPVLGWPVRLPDDGSEWTAKRMATKDGKISDVIERVHPSTPHLFASLHIVPANGQCSLAGFVAQKPSARMVTGGLFQQSWRATAVEDTDAKGWLMLACVTWRKQPLSVVVSVSPGGRTLATDEVVRDLLEALAGATR